ncbi:MAG: hypothetical protein R2706_20860 [Acidimicrobiales bacterium]
MNRSWKLLLSLLAVLSLVAAACGSDAETTDAASGDTTEGATPAGDAFNVGLTYDIGGRGDQSFNDSAAVGIEKAKSDLGITFTEVEPNADGSDRGAILQTQADGSALVIGVGFSSPTTSRPLPPKTPTSTSPWSTTPCSTSTTVPSHGATTSLV